MKHASSGAQSEAPRRSWELGRQQHRAPENQDSQHMLSHPSGFFPEFATRFTSDCPIAMALCTQLPTSIMNINRRQKITSSSTERQKRNLNLAPTSSGNHLWEFSGIFLGNLLPVLVFTGAAPPARQHQ